MKVPELRRKLVLEGPVRTADGAGGYAESWNPLGTLWGDIRPGSGRADDTGGVSVGSVPLKITVRAAPPGAASRPVAGQRFREGTRVYPILAVTEADGAARYLICTAREEVSR